MKEFMQYDFDIKKIVLSCFVPAGKGASVHKNRPSYGLAFHISGEKVYAFSNDKTLTVRANDIIYLPKYSNYEVLTKVQGDCYAINFDLEEDLTFNPFVVKTKNSKTILEHFRLANNIWKLKNNSYILKCKSVLYDIIYIMHQEYFSEYFPKSKLEIIQPAVDYIHNNYTDEIISIDFLSKLCNISPEYFRRIFKSFYGLSPINYINNLKISRAKELLESQMYSVTDAARMSGFTEMSYFSRAFKKSTTIAPNVYKNNKTNLIG